MSYRISTVSEMTGIPRNTLIAWERRYGLIRPERQANGYRYYSDEDVAELLRVKNALNAGLKISEAVNVLRRNRSTPKARGEMAAWGPDRDALCATARKELYEALVGYRGDDAHAILNGLDRVPFSTQLHEIYFPVLRSIGDGWERGQLSVAQEHFASGILRNHLAATFVSSNEQFLSAPHVVFATLPHDEHEIAALGLSVQLSQLGYRVTYLGARLPALDLVSFCNQQKPDLVCVSCLTLPSVQMLEEYCRQLSPILAQGTRVVLGGKCLEDSGFSFPDSVEWFRHWEDFAKSLETPALKSASVG